MGTKNNLQVYLHNRFRRNSPGAGKMKNMLLLVSVLFLLAGYDNVMAQSTNNERDTMKLNDLTAKEKHIMLDKGTEVPYSGEYVDNLATGTYICKQCDAPLFSSFHKFDSHCGWPSFDNSIEGAVKRIADPDGKRTEIICANCDGHLGHVFLDEGYTPKQTRHCVNSLSMKFIPASE